MSGYAHVRNGSFSDLTALTRGSALRSPTDIVSVARTSEKYQFRTHAPHKTRSMFDHRVGAGARRFIRATLPSEDPQSPTARLIARPKRSIQIL
jgi:hypothetical protein